MRSARILAEKEGEYMEHINSIHGLSTSGSEATDPKQLLTDVEEPYMFDLRSSHTSERDSTPERRRELRRPHPDDDDLRSLGSLTRPKLIP